MQRYVDAFERYDLDALVALLHRDVIQSMPPFAMWLQGATNITELMLQPGPSGCRGSRLLPTHANGCPAFAQYKPDPAGAVLTGGTQTPTTEESPMTTRNPTPTGTPCWADLWTSDVPASRRFYSQLFGWEALEPDPDFGGYFNFSRQGVWTAGGMGDMGNLKADDTWKPYLATEDIAQTVEAARAAGAEIRVPGMPVADLGVQAILSDPSGATLGLWQAGTWSGFSVVEEHGAPSWFELHTLDYAGALDFYRDVFGFEVSTISDTDQFRYSVLRRPGEETELGGTVHRGPDDSWSGLGRARAKGISTASAHDSETVRDVASGLPEASSARTAR